VRVLDELDAGDIKCRWRGQERLPVGDEWMFEAGQDLALVAWGNGGTGCIGLLDLAGIGQSSKPREVSTRTA